ncbi:hypothetical protein ACLK19_00600 [Escherichia coli]
MVIHRPVVVDLPKDILNPANGFPISSRISYIMHFSTIPLLPDIKGKLSVSIQTLVAAKKPVVYVGGGAIMTSSHQQLKETVEALNLPVVSSLMAWGRFRQLVVGAGHAGNARHLQSQYDDGTTRMSIFAVGVRFDDRTTNNLAKYCPNATVLHIDIRSYFHFLKPVAADIPIVAMSPGPRTNA